MSALGLLVLVVVAVVLLLTLIVAVAELSHRLASGSGRRTGSDTREAASEAIIVLGYPSPRYRGTHPLQRWRCEIAVRSMHSGRASTLIMTGSAGTGHRSEAEVMADYAHDKLGVPAEQIVLEVQARTTWENMELSLPLAARSAVIKIASDPCHARRARRYIAEIRPDLIARLEPAADYRLGEHWILKAGTLAYEASLAARRRLRRPVMPVATVATSAPSGQPGPCDPGERS